MLHNQALRDEQMRGHAETIEHEVEQMVADWGDEGEIDLLDWFAELTIYTSSACLIGLKFRERARRPRSRSYYHELEQRHRRRSRTSTRTLDIESFRPRDAARRASSSSWSRGSWTAGRPTRQGPSEDRDLLDVLMSVKDEDGSPRFTADEITGMFISMMFAGHHTTSGTASWTLIELLRHPEVLADVVAELDELYADGRRSSFQALRADPAARGGAQGGAAPAPAADPAAAGGPGRVRGRGFTDPRATIVAATPAVSQPDPRGLPRPRRVRSRAATSTPRQDDLTNRWTWIPFGAGRHRCVGAAFAMMQLKAIFSVLLREYEFEMAQPADTYRNDHSKMVVQLARPAKVRYRKRQA